MDKIEERCHSLYLEAMMDAGIAPNTVGQVMDKVMARLAQDRAREACDTIIQEAEDLRNAYVAHRGLPPRGRSFALPGIDTA